MIYLLFATLVYSWTAYDLAVGEPPQSYGDAFGAAVLGAVVAALWPVALASLLLGRVVREG